MVKDGVTKGKGRLERGEANHSKEDEGSIADKNRGEGKERKDVRKRRNRVKDGLEKRRRRRGRRVENVWRESEGRSGGSNRLEGKEKKRHNMGKEGDEGETKGKGEENE